MKKAASVCMTTVLALTLLAGGPVQALALAPKDAAPSAAAAENCISGSWKQASDPTVSETVRKMCDKAFEGLLGADYTPAAVLAERTTTSGNQYRVLCRRTVVVPGAEEEYVVVTLQRGWLGRTELLDIGEPLCPTDLSAGVLAGGWQEADSPALTGPAAEAFRKATGALVGVDYVPVALLSTQSVAGTNYRVLCEATVVYPGAEPYYAVVTVHEGLDGSAEILSIRSSADNGK